MSMGRGRARFDLFGGRAMSSVRWWSLGRKRVRDASLRDWRWCASPAPSSTTQPYNSLPGADTGTCFAPAVAKEVHLRQRDSVTLSAEYQKPCNRVSNTLSNRWHNPQNP